MKNVLHLNWVHDIDKWVSVKSIVNNWVLSRVQRQMLPDKRDISCWQLILSIHTLPVAKVHSFVYQAA